ncbi:VOC family protein [Amycolatopsis alkalitolerans]|uniref:VOC family protein n=1 Tax=Amycolatopsis alkalitolerans TaxID=2547244 RepID=A0A5C4LYR8_9PSEU|nr:VOC family protein [Amycolatopsis alkalitolerans]TNC24135.1 VOC family protein [Amycolatopsis alkalitolerans]
MTDVRFDHTIIAAHDKHASARFFADVFGLPEPREAGFFVAVYLSDGRVLDFAEPRVDFPGQHYAFLVDDETFDGIMARIRARSVQFWADPQMRGPGEINTNHGGRGVYFDDPAGHHLEALTARYDGHPSLT